MRGEVAHWSAARGSWPGAGSIARNRAGVCAGQVAGTWRCNRKFGRRAGGSFGGHADPVDLDVHAAEEGNMTLTLRVATAAIALMMAAAAGETALHQRADRYRLQPSDVLEVRFRFSPEFNETV